jgi:acyl carrier protein
MVRARPARVIHPQYLADKIRRIVSRTRGRRVTSDADDISLDFYFDEAGRTEMLMAVELAFRIDISKSEAAATSTVRRLIELVEEKTATEHPPIRLDEVQSVPSEGAHPHHRNRRLRK